MITKDKIQNILKSKGVVLEKLATDPHIYEKACSVAYKSIPIPFRWFVGKKRVRSLIGTIKENFIKKR